MKCENCGSELPENALFCDNCGQEVNRYDEKTEKTFCGSCGAEIKDGAEFCAECGAPIGGGSDSNDIFCGNCGAKMPADAKICGNCGQRLRGDDTAEIIGRAKQPKKNYAAVVVIVLSLIVLALAAAIFGYYLISGHLNNKNNGEESVTETADATASPRPTASPSPSASASPSPTASAAKLDTYYVVNCSDYISLREAPSSTANVIKNIPLGDPVSYVESSQNGFAKVIYNGTTGYALQAYLSSDYADVNKPGGAPEPPADNANNQPSNTGVVKNPTYNTYTDSYYNFSCAYPTHFKVYNDSDSFVRYSLKAPDNTATLKICATANSSGLTVQNVLDNFKLSYPGALDYESSGDTWCAVCTIQNGQCHYGYFHVGSDAIKGFEMHYDQSYYTTYDTYVNDIYDSLKFY